MKHKTQTHTLKIPPFRIQSIDFMTVTISPVAPYVAVATIEDLDALDIFDPDLVEIHVNVSQQCLSERILLRGRPTRRNIIQHIRECYRKLYYQATALGVRNEMDRMRNIIIERVRVEKLEDGFWEVFPEALEGINGC